MRIARKITIRGNIAIFATRKKRERRSLVSFSKSFLEGSKRNSGYKLVSRRGRGRERERKVLDDTRTYLSEVWGNRWFDNRKLETRRDARNFAIPQFKNWRKVERNGARMMKPGRHPLPCVYKASWPAPRALASIFAPPNFAFLECKFYRNERIARNEGGCSDSVLARPLRPAVPINLKEKIRAKLLLSSLPSSRSSYFPLYPTT